MGFPCDSAGKRIHLQCRRPGFKPWVGKITWRRKRLPTPVFWPGEFSPWGHKELDTTEQLTLVLSQGTNVEVIKGQRVSANRGRMREVCREQVVFNPSFGAGEELPQAEGLPGRSNMVMNISTDGGTRGVGMVQKLTI